MALRAAAAVAWLPLLLAAAVAGCLGSNTGETATTPAAAPRLALQDDAGAWVEPAAASLRWESSSTVGSGRHPSGNEGLASCLLDMCQDPPAPCTPQDCERRALRLDVPPGWWDGRDGWLELSVRWPTSFDDWFQLRVEDAGGATVATGHGGYMQPFGLVARLDRPAAGDYTAVVV